MNYTASPQINLSTLYPDQASAVYGKRQKPTIPLETQLEAEKPGFMQAVASATKTQQAEDQFRKNMQMMQQQLDMQKDAARNANMIKGAGLAVQAGKLAYDTGLFSTDAAKTAAESVAPEVYKNVTQAAMAPVTTDLMGSMLSYDAPVSLASLFL